MASRDKKDLNYLLVEAYERACNEYKKRYPNEPQPFITCTYRSNVEQDALYRQPTDGKDNNGNGKVDESAETVTWARPGESPHNYLPSLAFDIAFINLKQKLDWSPIYFKRFSEIIISLSEKIRWGGDWNGNGITTDEKKSDSPHFELKNWKNYLNQNQKP